MFAAGKTAAVSGAGPDDKFNYVTMLLHGDGTNGAQNNTFLDSSTNNFTITRNGNTTQGSFSPYGDNWGNYFNGTNAYLTPPASSVVLGSSDFTVEYWLFASNNNSHLNSASTAGGSFTFLVSSNADFYYGNGTSWENNIPFTSGTLTQNTWHHIAMTRQSSTMRLFLNGVLQGSASVSVSIPSNYWQIGAQTRNSVYLDGYISNFRIVSGTALYTSNFTPSTTPLTAVSGTSLLTCQSNRFIDDSTNNFAITVNGTPSVQRFNPFGASTAYSTSVIGGSGYFDGSGDYLTVPDDAALDFGTGNFTMEAWVYATNLSNSPFLMHKSTGNGTNTGWFIELDAGIVYFGPGTTGGTFATFTSSAISTNNWFHIAVTRVSTTLQCFVNGTSIGTSTLAGYGGSKDNAAVFGIGSWAVVSSAYDLNGYVSNLRVVKGTAVYTANFTPPTAPLTAISGASLLLNFTNGAIFDNAMMNDLETVGNAQISTSVVKYGTGSMAFDGAGDYLQTPLTPNLQLGTGDFTIECWTYLISKVVSYPAIFSNYNSFTTGALALFAGHNSGTTTAYQVAINGSGFPGIEGGTISYNNWVHLAVVRYNGTISLYVNGVSVGTPYTTSVTLNGVGSNFYIGSTGDDLANGYINGYIDDLRITKGYARYTANFTPPTAAFPNIGPY